MKTRNWRAQQGLGEKYGLSVILMAVLLCLGGAARRGDAHGLHGHVHVTGWAIENLPPGELRTMFEDPDVFQAALSGAMFPDTGYATDAPGARDYAEYAHWEPFIERFIQYVRTTYGPTYETKEEKMLIAFLLGCAAHGLQDELFDSTFLYEVEERYGRGQEVADPATDGFLILDGLFRLLPGDYFPVDEVLPLYEVLGRPIDAPLIREHIRIVRDGYVNDHIGARIAMGNGRRFAPFIPWVVENYLDMGAAGSLGAEIKPTGRHMQALWDRLHGRFDEANLVVHAWPEDPRRLRTFEHASAASWITLVFGKGVEENSATAKLVDALGTPHPFRLRYTRWGGTSRLIRFQTTEDLTPGAHYTATVEPGARLVDGSLTTHAHSHSFQVECGDDPEAGVCEPIEIEGDPTIVRPVFSETPTATATPTATESPSATPTATHTVTSSPTSTSTALPSATRTPIETATTAPSATLAPSSTPTLSPTLVPTVSPTLTATLAASPTTTRVATASSAGNGSDGSCHVSSEPSSSHIAWLVPAALLLLQNRRRRPPTP